MKSLRRITIPHVYYFITIVTYRRTPLLLNDIELFWRAWKEQQIYAWVILPDHFHIILNPKNNNISDIIHRFKITYSRHFRDRYQPGRVWQNRFWDHVIRDQKDMNNHIDYIHYNPIKHRLVKSLSEYSHSSFNKFLKDGFYPQNWGNTEIIFEGNYGE